MSLICLAVLLAGCATSEKPCCGGGKMAAATAAGTHAGPVNLNVTWQDDQGRDFRLSELHGRPVVISMFYATCQGVCVITRDDMQAVEASLPPTVRDRAAFVLVTLAPDRDTPAVLRDYRNEFGLSAKRWVLLRGTPAQTTALAAQLSVDYGRDATGLFRHSSELVVLDSAGHVVLQQDGVHADLTETVQTLVAAAK